MKTDNKQSKNQLEEPVFQFPSSILSWLSCGWTQQRMKKSVRTEITELCWKSGLCLSKRNEKLLSFKKSIYSKKKLQKTKQLCHIRGSWQKMMFFTKGVFVVCKCGSVEKLWAVTVFPDLTWLFFFFFKQKNVLQPLWYSGKKIIMELQDYSYLYIKKIFTCNLH